MMNAVRPSSQVKLVREIFRLQVDENLLFLRELALFVQKGIRLFAAGRTQYGPGRSIRPGGGCFALSGCRLIFRHAAPSISRARFCRLPKGPDRQQSRTVFALRPCARHSRAPRPISDADAPSWAR